MFVDPFNPAIIWTWYFSNVLQKNQQDRCVRITKYLDRGSGLNWVNLNRFTNLGLFWFDKPVFQARTVL